MGYNYKMRGKTQQQQIIVAKKAASEEMKRKDAAKRAAEEKKKVDAKEVKKIEYPLLAVNKDTCPDKDNIIIKSQCGTCKHYRGFAMYNEMPSIKCGYDVFTDK